MEENNIHPEESGLADELNQYIQFTQASQGQRFVNWLIDNLLMRFGLSYLTGTAVGYLMAKLGGKGMVIGKKYSLVYVSVSNDKKR